MFGAGERHNVVVVSPWGMSYEYSGSIKVSGVLWECGGLFPVSDPTTGCGAEG